MKRDSSAPVVAEWFALLLHWVVGSSPIQAAAGVRRKLSKAAFRATVVHHSINTHAYGTSSSVNRSLDYVTHTQIRRLE